MENSELKFKSQAVTSILYSMDIEIDQVVKHNKIMPHAILKFRDISVKYCPTYLLKDNTSCCAMSEIDRLHYTVKNIQNRSTTMVSKLMFIGEFMSKFKISKLKSQAQNKEELQLITRCIALYKQQVTNEYRLFSHTIRGRALRWAIASRYEYRYFTTIHQILSNEVVAKSGTRLIQL